MNETTAPPTRPYEVIAYGGLGVAALMQMLEGNPLGALLPAGCGMLAMFARMQMGPIFYLVLSAGAMLAHYNQGLGARSVFRPSFFDVTDIVTCIGVLAFVAAHYRLQGIWYHHLVRDPRRRGVRGALRSFHLSMPQPEDAERGRRKAEHVGQTEVSWLILSLSVWVLTAQFLTRSIPLVRVAGVEPWLVRMLLVVWVLSLTTFVVVSLLDVWKRYRMSASAARIFLQDALWRETRGEQRRMQRWLAWRRIRRLAR